MPRIARNVIPDIPYHVIHRGNNHQKIFFSDADYNYFLSLINEAKRKYPCKLYSYVLMPNHIHLLIEPFREAENIGRFIKLIAQKYAQRVNGSQKRTGTLWEGRFKSSPVSTDRYLLACARYIELNPVRAQIVSEPGEYKWSSYRFKTGDNDAGQLLDEDPLYTDLGKDDKERQINYRRWIKGSVPSEEWSLIRTTVNRGCIFGNNKFKEKLENILGRSFDIRRRGRPVKKKKEK